MRMAISGVRQRKPSSNAPQNYSNDNIWENPCRPYAVLRENAVNATSVPKIQAAEETILMRDFSQPDIFWGTREAQGLVNNNNLKQYVEEPTTEPDI